MAARISGAGALAPPHRLRSKRAAHDDTAVKRRPPPRAYLSRPRRERPSLLGGRRGLARIRGSFRAGLLRRGYGDAPAAASAAPARR